MQVLVLHDGSFKSIVCASMIQTLLRGWSNVSKQVANDLELNASEQAAPLSLYCRDNGEFTVRVLPATNFQDMRATRASLDSFTLNSKWILLNPENFAIPVIDYMIQAKDVQKVCFSDNEYQTKHGYFENRNITSIASQKLHNKEIQNLRRIMCCDSWYTNILHVVLKTYCKFLVAGSFGDDPCIQQSLTLYRKGLRSLQNSLLSVAKELDNRNYDITLCQIYNSPLGENGLKGAITTYFTESFWNEPNLAMNLYAKSNTMGTLMKRLSSTFEWYRLYIQKWVNDTITGVKHFYDTGEYLETPSELDGLFHTRLDTFWEPDEVIALNKELMLELHSIRIALKDAVYATCDKVSTQEEVLQKTLWVRTGHPTEALAKYILIGFALHCNKPVAVGIIDRDFIGTDDECKIIYCRFSEQSQERLDHIRKTFQNSLQYRSLVMHSPYATKNPWMCVPPAAFSEVRTIVSSCIAPAAKLVNDGVIA